MSTSSQAATALVMKFFAALDTREHRVAANLMAPDGVWWRQGRQLTGPAAVLAALEQRPANRHTCHVVTNVQFAHVDDQRAELSYYLTAYESLVDDAPEGAASADGATARGAAPVRLAGILLSEDQLTVIDGQWRIHRKSSRRMLPP